MSSSCSICLESDFADGLFITNCCKNRFHSCCISDWVIYKGRRICPLCNSDNMYIPIDTILNHSRRFINDKTVMKNVQFLINDINNSEYTIIIINNSDIIQERASRLYEIRLEILDFINNNSLYFIFIFYIVFLLLISTAFIKF